MTEAVSCVVDYAFKDLQLELISTYRFSYNHRSGRVMDKTGFVYEGTLRQATERFDGALLDVSCFSQTRQEWQDRQRKQEDRKMRWKRLLFDLDGTITDPKVGITKVCAGSLWNHRVGCRPADALHRTAAAGEL